MAPSEILLIPLVVLATVATVIASQAVISGAFSLTSQAMQLGYCPRIRVKFTSEREKGQIYVPNINWLLLLTVIIVVLGFRSSSNLASAYGIAVTLTMMIDTILAFVVVRALWKWSWPRAALFLVFFVVVDFAFFSANVIKILDGGWFPLALGFAVFALLSTWRLGRKLLYEKLQQDSIPLDAFIASLVDGGPHRVDGTGIFLTAEPQVCRVRCSTTCTTTRCCTSASCCSMWLPKTCRMSPKRARARRSPAGGISSGVCPLRLQG
jgi:KUP system potassium uptake protein